MGPVRDRTYPAQGDVSVERSRAGSCVGGQVGQLFHKAGTGLLGSVRGHSEAISSQPVGCAADGQRGRRQVLGDAPRCLVQVVFVLGGADVEQRAVQICRCGPRDVKRVVFWQGGSRVWAKVVSCRWTPGGTMSPMKYRAIVDALPGIMRRVSGPSESPWSQTCRACSRWRRNRLLASCVRRGRRCGRHARYATGTRRRRGSG